MSLILFNKPMNVICQFSPHTKYASLSDYLSIPHIYPAGRLDADSEGLILLTNDGRLQHKISHPDKNLNKTYLVQVEGNIETKQLSCLQNPLNLGNFTTLPCQAAEVHSPTWLWERNPPIRTRTNSPTSWLSLTLNEGKNRQVRRMTAAVGLPTLRLIRIGIGPIQISTYPLSPGEWTEINPNTLFKEIS